jgi:hypothetical protein
MSDPIPADRERAPKVRWQSSARWTLVAVVGVVIIGGLGFYLLFLRGEASPPAPARPAVTSMSTTTLAGSTP